MTLAELKALAERATNGPWSVESCGEKGDGANMIGVSFHPDDEECKTPLSGWLEPFDDDGEEIEYYRDELVAVCDHTNRNASYDAAYIAALSPERILAMIAVCEHALKAPSRSQAMAEALNALRAQERGR